MWMRAMSLLAAAAMSGLLAAAPPGQADSVTHASNASRLSLLGSTASVRGSGELLSAGGEVVVVSVRTVGQSTEVVVRGLAEGSREVLLTLVLVGGGLSLATGEVLTLSATGVGYLVTKGGEVVAYIPNQVGQTLVHHSLHEGR